MMIDDKALGATGVGPGAFFVITDNPLPNGPPHTKRPRG